MFEDFIGYSYLPSSLPPKTKITWRRTVEAERKEMRWTAVYLSSFLLPERERRALFSLTPGVGGRWESLGTRLVAWVSAWVSFQSQTAVNLPNLECVATHHSPPFFFFSAAPRCRLHYCRVLYNNLMAEHLPALSKPWDDCKIIFRWSRREHIAPQPLKLISLTTLRLGRLLLPPGWDASSSQVYPSPSILIYYQVSLNFNNLASLVERHLWE